MCGKYLLVSVSILAKKILNKFTLEILQEIVPAYLNSAVALKSFVSNQFICRTLQFQFNLVFESFVHFIFINSTKGNCITVYATPEVFTTV